MLTKLVFSFLLVILFNSMSIFAWFYNDSKISTWYVIWTIATTISYIYGFKIKTDLDKKIRELEASQK